ncbi:Lcl C-terminal domain-containing protein [Roseateles albus]|uniref:PEP-CTERM protein-sorting domain-containing protein n=1 Tax=Roseateles albus TaxID=2987525 RepID=A0ABT5KFJ2_9BURK|nr:hypothetical protein [Roseateles albus]MDC8771735.1 hypothetical protein [Roseateles albus]
MKIRLTGLVAMALASFVGSGNAASIPGQGTWETTLQARDLDGSVANGPEAFYDSALHITWLRLGTTNTISWATAKDWAEQNRFGLGGWRLPTTIDKGLPGCDWALTGGTDCGYNPDSSVSTGSEMAHLFFETLGNKSMYVPGTINFQSGFGPSNTGGFQNLRPDGYWSGSVYETASNQAWSFSVDRGVQGPSSFNLSMSALAVRDGDVISSVPESQTYALLLVGLGLIAGVAHRRNHQ